jgi:hypothetical protein
MQLTKAEPVAERPSFIRRKRLLILVSVIALTEFLVFRHGPGHNLFLLSVLLTAAFLLAAAKLPSPRTAVALGWSVATVDAITHHGRVRSV